MASERPAALHLELRAVQGHAEELLREMRETSARLNEASDALDDDKAMFRNCERAVTALVLALALITTRTRVEAPHD